VSIVPSDNGTVNVQLPAEVAELFLLDLEQRAKEWQEAMHKARLQEIQRNAELKAATGESLRQWEAQEESWAVEYEKLWAKGKGHREALHIIRGSNDRDAILVTDVEIAVQAGLARLRRQRRKARDEEICRLGREGVSRQGISDALRISYSIVNHVLNRVGISPRDARHDRKGTMGTPTCQGNHVCRGLVSTVA
jgi:tRNA A37 N6-isopentenylltransferase MiaA